MKVIDIRNCLINKYCEDGIVPTTVGFDSSVAGCSKDEMAGYINQTIINMKNGMRIPLRRLQSVLETASLFDCEPHGRVVVDFERRVDLYVREATETRMTGSRFMDEYVKSGGFPSHFYGEKVKTRLNPNSLAGMMFEELKVVKSWLSLDMPERKKIAVQNILKEISSRIGKVEQTESPEKNDSGSNCDNGRNR